MFYAGVSFYCFCFPLFSPFIHSLYLYPHLYHSLPFFFALIFVSSLSCGTVDTRRFFLAFGEGGLLRVWETCCR